MNTILLALCALWNNNWRIMHLHCSSYTQPLFGACQQAVQHVQTVITTCAQTLYALHVLQAHGLCDSALRIILGQS